MDLGSAPVAELIRTAATSLELAPESRSDWGPRAQLVTMIARALDDRGIDGESLIRFGMAGLLQGPVLGSVAISLVVGVDEPTLARIAELVDVQGWRRALRLDGVDAGGHLGAALDRAAALTNGWVAFAPLEHLVTMQPATATQMESWASAVDGATKAAAASYRWAVTRLTARELGQWDLSSLRKEYRYAVLGEDPRVPPSLVEKISLDLDDLAHAIVRTELREEEEHQRLVWNSAREAVLKHARMLVAQDRCVEAATLFEFLIGQDPSDPWLRINYAFCLVPLRPSEAYETLREAQRLGFKPVSLALYNRACCAASISQKRDVLFEANRLWVDGLEPAPVSALVWRRSEKGFEAFDSPDVRVQLAEMAAQLSLELGDLNRATTWRERSVEIAQLAI